jgi:4-hydroxy-tetrahydrodipicolinate synthase
MAEIGRLLTAMVTPLSRDGALDYAQAGRLARALLDSGSEGLVVAGTTGESPTLTTREKLRLFSEIKQAAGGRGAVVAGTGNYNTAESIELSREAERLGVDALLLTVPYYNKPSQEGMFRHFEAIARATSLPCILYNIPGRTGVNMTAETTLRLSRIPNIAGIKEASGDLVQIATIINGVGGAFRVWSGNDEDTLPILALGGYGVISVASHLAGVQIATMIRTFVDGDAPRAAEMHRRLLPLIKALFLAGNPSSVKYALAQAGFDAGQPRLPLVEPEEALAVKIRDAVRAARIDLPVSV